MIPTLTTDRLTLGPFKMPHFAAFADFMASDRSRYIGGPSDDPRAVWDRCMVQIGQWQVRGYGGFFATETATGTPLGRFSVWHPITLDEPELSWIVYGGFEGKGYAAEGVRAVRNWAIAQGIGPLQSLIAAENTRSIALAELLGCTTQGTHTYASGETVLRYRHPTSAQGMTSKLETTQ